jgi:hypothetical protein
MKLPPWSARNERERQQMFEWVCAKLQEARANGAGAPLIDFLKSDAPAILAAWQGDVQPLRARYPHLAPFLDPPKRKRGQYNRKLPSAAVQQAVEDVKAIRRIWKKHYPGKTRHAGDGLSAIQIAARRNSFADETEEIARRVDKPSGQHRRAK